MPMFALKSPDKFPAEFHRALERAFWELYESPIRAKSFHTGVLAPLEYHYLAQREQKRFQAFRMCLRRHPLHRLHGALAALETRCEILGGPGAYYLVVKFTRRFANLDVLQASL